MTSDFIILFTETNADDAQKNYMLIKEELIGWKEVRKFL